MFVTGRRARSRGSAALTALVVLALCACAAPVAPSSGGGSAASASAPAPPPPPPTPEELRHARAVEIVSGLGTRQRVASVVMTTAPGFDAAELGSFAQGNGLGGFIIMSGNVPAEPAALAALTAALSPDPAYPLLIAIDQEGGVVSRLPWDGHPGADSLRFAPPEAARDAFAGRAALLRSLGINVNFGIVADVSDDPWSFVYWRTLGDSPADAASRVSAAVSGEHGAVASTLKHFPGHGAVAGDSHFGIPGTALDLAGWEATQAPPFAAGIDAGAELLMFGHLAYTSIDPLPASLSVEWHRIARERLGFTGVAISDDLGMLLDSGLPEYQDLAAIVVQSLAAGADVALLVRGTSPETLPALIDAVAAAVEEGRLSPGRLREAAIRVAELRLAIGERAG